MGTLRRRCGGMGLRTRRGGLPGSGGARMRNAPARHRGRPRPGLRSSRRAAARKGTPASSPGGAWRAPRRFGTVLPERQSEAASGHRTGRLAVTARAQSRCSALVTTYGRRSRAALQIGPHERVLPILAELVRWLTMPCGMCVAAMVRSGIGSWDLALRSRGCRGLLRVRRHDRDGSRVFVAPVGLPGPVWARRPP
jgi:hypothetical protein